MVVKCNVKIMSINYLEFTSETWENVLTAVIQQLISCRIDFHDTRGCNGKFFNELFGNGDD